MVRPSLWQVGAQHSHHGIIMQPIYIFRHHPNEGPGYQETYLRMRAIPMRLLAIDRGDAVPDNVCVVCVLVFLGGFLCVFVFLFWFVVALRLIRAACTAGMLVLGFCLG